MNIYEKHNIHQRRLERLRKKKRQQKILKISACVGVLCLLCVLGAVVGSKFLWKEDTEAKTGKEQETVAEESNEKVEKSSATITLQGESFVQLKLGEEFVDPGFSAKDKDGTDLSLEVQVDASALTRAGKQRVTYKVQGNNGVEEQVFREVDVLPNTEYGAKGLPICMYHYVYDPSEPPEKQDANFMSTDTLAEEMKYLQENGYYFPTWQEVRDYVDGKLLLPEKSIVITFDDGPNYMNLGTPILEQYQVPATSFVIASYWDSKEMLYGYASDYLRFESHSYKMHQGGGGKGHGGIYTALSKEEIIADLQKSFEICGNKDAFAYPFGDYTEDGCATLEEAGLLCAVTTEPGKCFPGDNPYLLPRVRMFGSQSLNQFAAAIE